MATLAGRVVAFARAGHFRPEAGAPTNAAPEGWYLTGVVVAPPARRGGVALALTRARLARLRARGAGAAFYFANERNRASIDLHARLGFAEWTRDFWFPGVEFTGGRGVLFRLAL